MVGQRKRFWVLQALKTDLIDLTDWSSKIGKKIHCLAKKWRGQGVMKKKKEQAWNILG